MFIFIFYDTLLNSEKNLVLDYISSWLVSQLVNIHFACKACQTLIMFVQSKFKLLVLVLVSKLVS